MRRYAFRLYATALLLSFFATLLFVKIVNTKSTVFKKENEAVAMIRSLLPQSWGFFTRNPREASLLVYTLQGSEFVPIDFIGRRSQVMFNVSREARFLARETGRLMEQLKTPDWKPCKEDPRTCGKDLHEIPVDNTTRAAELCGSFLLVQQEIVPWAWSLGSRSIQMPSLVARVSASCLEKDKNG